ncbi:zinc finger protein 1035 [Echeneis naucrates]|uniref:zinc finger protein 1035 n=1 Tax=Echeneis naucrates TaxID=173247 RepID=UPI001113EFB1|nr:uncharacterized protein LOC115044582 [Echeneis naucrates]XP_029359556.1 uncharacterized protein LOC115044582 [Echeneis naucrates]
MAHEWDSYFNDLPPLSPDPRKTSELEGSISQHLENLIDDFTDQVASNEGSAVNTNYYSPRSIGNSSTDCVYQTYDKETLWQVDGEQMEKVFLPNCGNSDISELATDGSNSFPSSFATDSQGFKQDCRIIDSSFPEDFSDVISCSDLDGLETKPSCKFMESNSVPKPKTDDVTKCHSSEQLISQSRNMVLCSDTSAANINPSNVKAEEIIVLTSTEHNQSFPPSNSVTVRGSETAEDTNCHEGCQDHEQEDDVERNPIEGKHSDISISGNGNAATDGLVESPNGSDGGQITAAAPIHNEPYPLEEKKLRKEMEELFNRESEGSENLSLACDQNEMSKGDQDQNERKIFGSLENETFDKQSTPLLCSTDSQDENMQTDCKGEKNMSELSNDKEADSKDACHELSENNTKGNSTDVESCLQLLKSHECVTQDNICRSLVVERDDHLSNVSDKEEQSVSDYPEFSFQADISIADINPCLEKEMASPPETNTTIPCTDPNHSGPNVTSGSSTNMHSCVEKECPSKKTDTASSTDPEFGSPAVMWDRNEICVSQNIESHLQSDISSTDTQLDLKKDCQSPAKNKNATTSLDQQQLINECPPGNQEPRNLCGDVTENARESFEAPDASTGVLVPDMLYGEPLSREDSSCDTDETGLGANKSKKTIVAKTNLNSADHSEEQMSPLQSSREMRNHLQPVVLLKTLESVNGSTSYHCGNCQHTTYNVDSLIEHHHCCHSVHNFQFCKACNLFLVRTEQAEHLCYVTKEGPSLSSDSTVKKKRKRFGQHKCIKCRLTFSTLVQYVRHMRTHTGTTPYKCNECGLYFAQGGTLTRHKRVPGRCKRAKRNFRTVDAATSDSKTLPQKDLLQNKLRESLSEWQVKLVDISKTHLCHLCGKVFLTAERAKMHFDNLHKAKNLAVSAGECTNGENTQEVDETKENFKCPLCPRLFKYSYNRARHLRDCVRDAICGGKEKVCGKYRCPLCHVSFTLPSNRFRHIKAICLKECLNRLAKERAKLRQKDEQNGTKESEQKTQSNENKHRILSEENKQKTPVKKNELKTGSKEIEQKRQETPAIRAPKTFPRHKCNLCPAVFCYSSGKYRHMKKHELFKLTGKMFRYRNSVFSMSKTATPSNTNDEEGEMNRNPALSCEFCGKYFATSQSLKKHERSHRGERPYHCLECGKGFKRHSHLIVHKKVHQKRIQCTVCRKILPTIGELIQHRSSHLKRGMLQCPDCDQQFQYPVYLLRHLETHKNREKRAPQSKEREPLGPPTFPESLKEQGGSQQLQCSLCKEVFDNAQALRKHCFTHIPGTSSSQCPFCKKGFSGRRYLLLHMVKHTGDKPFSCTNCGKQFYRSLYLKLHSERCLFSQTKMNTKKPHRCSYCPRSFCKKARLKSHHRGHNTNSLLKCLGCGQYFGFSKLDQHQMNCGGINVGSCGGITKITSQPNQSVYKMPSQSNASKMLPFKCSYCTQRYRYRSLLLRHLVSHTGLQPYACMHCSHRFGSQTMCFQHEAFCDGVYKEGQPKDKHDSAANVLPTVREAAPKQTEGEAEYKCKFCTKTFFKSQNLRRHILTHNEVKPYRCKACDNSFSRYDHLKVHQARCKGKKPRLEVCIPKISLDDVGKGWQNKFNFETAEKQETFECTVCSSFFPSQPKLSRHVAMFHATKLFKCTRCDSSFTHEKSLKRHRRINKCKKVTIERNASVPMDTDPPKQNGTNQVHVATNRILQRIKPNFRKRYNYVCSYCSRTFANSWQLGVHTRLHTGEKPYACEYCDQRFIRKDYVQRHFAKCTKKQQAASKALCNRCGVFFLKINLEEHEKNCTLPPSSSKSTVLQTQESTSQSTPKGFSCAYCSSRFLLFSQLQEHFLNAHKKETLVPPVSTAPLQHHLSNILNIKEEPLEEVCDKQLGDGANLICKLDDRLDGDVQQPFFCKECNMFFGSKAGLTGHLRVHTAEHPFNCKTCNKGFWNKSLLRNHYRKCRFGRVSRGTTKHFEGPLKAEIDFALNDSARVFKEASMETDTRAMQTNFSHKDDLMEDSSKNSESNKEQQSSKVKKPVTYQCSECDQSFTDGLLLISHLEEHGRQEQEKKSATCTKCGRVFISQGHLQKHMKIHGFDQKYPCPDCTKVANTISELEIHRTCHDQNRPYVCKLCDQRFWTRPSLCNHYREDHPEDAFTCHFCNKAYSVKKSLARHIRKWHQNERKDVAKSLQEKSSTEQSSSQVSMTGESGEEENDATEDSDSDSAPYFPCHVCGKTFPTSESLEDHQRCHLGEKPHECEECGRCFFQASQLQQHQRMHKSEFQCQACGRGFVSLFALRKHKHTHGKSRPYRCSKCHFSFTGPLQLAEHMKTHREENFPCDICDCVFLSKSSRAEHRKSHSSSGNHSPSPALLSMECEKSPLLSESSSAFTKELKYRCGVCNDRFRDPEELSEHGCMAAKERPYTCNTCNKHFLDPSHLRKHKTTYHQSGSGSNYKCFQSNISFPTPYKFLSHLRTHTDNTAGIKHNTEAKDSYCPSVPTQLDDTHKSKTIFPSASKLEEPGRRHLISTTEFECTECGQSFLGSDVFRQHRCLNKHHAKTECKHSNPSVKASHSTNHPAAGEEEEIDVTGGDLYNCPNCSIQFFSKSSLLEHLNKHLNAKPFKCELCGKAFALRRYLKEHERRHRLKMAAQGIAQFTESKLKCNLCNMTFNTAEDLSLHKKLHVEKEGGQFRCDMCYMSFSHRLLLKQHQESHVGEVVYECTECDKAFAFPHLLEQHQQTHAVHLSNDC